MKYTYKEAIELSYKALDLIPDLKKFFKRSESLEYTMEEIEDAFYYNAYAGQPVDKFMQEHFDFFRGEIFNYIDADEFLTYAKERFPEIKWGHEIIENWWITEVGDP